MKRKDIHELVRQKVSRPFGRGFSYDAVINEGTDAEQRCDDMQELRQSLKEGDQAAVYVYMRTGGDRELVEKVEFEVTPYEKGQDLSEKEKQIARLLGRVLGLTDKKATQYGIRYEPVKPSFDTSVTLVVPDMELTRAGTESSDFYVLNVYIEGHHKATLEKEEGKPWTISEGKETRPSALLAVVYAASIPHSLDSRDGST